MKFFLDFLHQKVPKAGKEIPAYYRRALATGEVLQAVYFLACFFLYPLINHGRWEWIPLLFLALTGGCLWAAKNKGIHLNLFLYAAICLGWVFWNVQHFGWSSGVQHFLTLMIVLVFFNVYDKPLYKIFWLIAILAFRILLFSISQRVPAIYKMDTDANTIYQTLNTVAFFLMLAGMCIIFSTSIQDTERQLRLKNQTLYKEAGTDPLTGLPNRRAMIEQIEQQYKINGDQPFSVAIADIDFFKTVNDTYGHNCGDYTLVKLTELFVEHSMGRYSVCRWGGEEFCFFMPGLNLDQAGALMNDLCFAVEKMKLKYEEHDFSITITIGVEEFDFASPLEELLNTADEKLYMGKNAGRNRVVV
jgi:diguanylate cyclase (GGDEF)-like protein